MELLGKGYLTSKNRVECRLLCILFAGIPIGIKARFCITTDNLSKEAWTKNVQASLFIQGLLSPLMLQYIHMPA